MQLSVGVIIPALNEENTIAQVIESVKPYAKKVIVSSDGSTDKTVKVATEAGAIVIDNKINQGPEYATELGYKEALKHNLDVFVTFDADGQHLPEYIPEMIKLIEDNKADIVVGMRKEFPRFSEYFFSWYSNMRIGIRDPICGLKAVRSKIYKDIGYFDTVKGITAQILFQAHKRKYKLSQIPINILEREDIPRFGRAFRANTKMLLGLSRIILNDIGLLK